MKHFLIPWLLLSAYSEAGAQQSQTLYGYVYEQSSGRKPVKDVMVKASFANQIATADNGSYTLTFQNARPGRAVVLVAEKQNWVITDKGKLEVNLPEDPFSHPHAIIMCREAVWRKQNEDNRAAIEKYLRQSYEKQIAKLNRQSKNYQHALDSLEEQYTKLERSLANLPDEMSRVNLDDVTADERKAYELFKEGKVDSSLQLRERMESKKKFLEADHAIGQLDRLRDKISAKKEEYDSARNMHKRNLREVARLAQMTFDFAKAKETLEFLAINDSTDVENLFNYGSFLQMQNQIDDAIAMQKKALRATAFAYQKSLIKNALGELFRVKHDYVAAEQACLEALHLAQGLAEKDSVLYETDIAVTQLNLGNIYQEKKQFDTAEKMYQKALVVFRQLDKTYPEKVGPALATLLNNLGLIYVAKSDYAKAKVVYAQSLDILNRKSPDNPDYDWSSIAMTQTNLGRIYMQEDDYARADQAYREAAKIYDRLAANNPAAYETYVAAIQDNLGMLSLVRKDYDSAEKTFRFAMNIRVRLADLHPEIYDPDLAKSHFLLGNLYMFRNDTSRSKTEFVQALDIFRKIAKTNLAFEPEVANTLNQFGYLSMNMRDYPNAERMMLEALEIRTRLAKGNPGIYESDIAETQNNLGMLNARIGKSETAEKTYLDVLATCRQLAKEHPALYEAAVATVQNNLGVIYTARKDYTSAIQALKEALEIRHRLMISNPDIYGPDVVNTQVNLGSLYAKQKDYHQAEKAYQEALSINRQLAKINPGIYTPAVAAVQYELGVLYVKDSNYQAADTALNEAKSIYESLSIEMPGTYLAYYANTLFQLGHLYFLEGNIDSAISTLLASLKNFGRLERQEKELYQADIARALRKLGNMYSFKQDYANAGKMDQAALAIYQQLASKDSIGYKPICQDLSITLIKVKLDQSNTPQEKLPIQQQLTDKLRDNIKEGRSDYLLDFGTQLGGLAWYLILDSQFAAAEKAAREALYLALPTKPVNYDRQIEWVNTNLALSLLLQGKYDEAEKIYLQFKDKPWRNKILKDFFLADLDEVEKSGIKHEDIARIRNLLQH